MRRIVKLRYYVLMYYNICLKTSYILIKIYLIIDLNLIYAKIIYFN